MGTTVIALIIILVFDFRPILHNKKRKEIWGYAVLLSIAAVVILLHEAGVMLPSVHIQLVKLLSPLLPK